MIAFHEERTPFPLVHERLKGNGNTQKIKQQISLTDFCQGGSGIWDVPELEGLRQDGSQSAKSRTDA